MKMEPIFEWPELSQSSAKSRLEYYSEVLDKHERGAIDPPLPPEEVMRYRQTWAELNYLANGKVAIAEANCDCSDCVDEDELEDEEDEHQYEAYPPVESIAATSEPVFATADLVHKWERIATEGENLLEIVDRLEKDIAYAERRGDRSDAAIIGWAPFIIDARSKLSKVKEAIDQLS